MHRITETIRRNFGVLIRLLPFFAFIPPIVILYSLYAWSFEQTLHGRTFLLFFLWLVFLEMVMSWEKLAIKLNKIKSLRTFLLVMNILLPTIYVIVENYCGLNVVIENVAESIGVEKISWPVISVEYLVFMIFLILIVLLLFGVNSLLDFSVSIIFAGVIGTLFLIDNLYPYGRFTPLQMLVPATTTIVTYVFNLMGYSTNLSIINSRTYGSIPYLTVINQQGDSVGLGIAWACSGIESLMIYAVTIVLFLRKMNASIKIKTAYFLIGAIITYLISIFRIVTLFLLAFDYSIKSPQWQQFHNYYGMLYTAAWITVYPLIIAGSHTLWNTVRYRKIQKGIT
ncbi:MAG: exosortase/archaeosortase family protein [Candidatus Bathycorpusculaceae bacterium]